MRKILYFIAGLAAAAFVAQAQVVPLQPYVIQLSCTNKVVDNNTNTTSVGQPIPLGDYRYAGIQVSGNLTKTEAKNAWFLFSRSCDGNKYTTRTPIAIPLAFTTGGAEAVTNTVVDLAGYTHIKLAALGLEDTATADATNIVVTVTLKKNYW